MIIPSFANVQFVEENGYLTSSMQMYNDELNRILRNGLSDDGWTVPNLTAAQITQISPEMPAGTLWFNTDLKKLVVKTDFNTNTIEVIQSV